jgi:hypothetical protein
MTETAAPYATTETLAELIADYADTKSRLLVAQTLYNDMLQRDPDLRLAHQRVEMHRESLEHLDKAIRDICHQTGLGIKAHGWEVKVSKPVKKVTDWAAVAEKFPALVQLGVIQVTHTADPKHVEPMTKSIVGLGDVLAANTVEIPQTPRVLIVPVAK